MHAVHFQAHGRVIHVLRNVDLRPRWNPADPRRQVAARPGSPGQVGAASPARRWARACRCSEPRPPWIRSGRKSAVRDTARRNRLLDAIHVFVAADRVIVVQLRPGWWPCRSRQLVVYSDEKSVTTPILETIIWKSCGSTIVRIRSSTLATYCSVSSMREPVGAFRLIVNWPASVRGKKATPEQRDRARG